MKGKVGVVFRREFLSTVKRPGWLIPTFGMPVFVGLYAGLIFLIASAGAKLDKPVGKAAIVDHAGIVRFEAGPTSPLAEAPHEAKEAIDRVLAMSGKAGGDGAAMAKSLLSGTQFIPFDDEQAALAAMARKEVGALYVIPKDYVATGKITAYDPSESIVSEGKLAMVPLRLLLVRSLTADHLPPEVAERILNPVDATTLLKRPDGTWTESGLGEKIRRLGVPFAFVILLAISIVASGGTMIQGVSEEKETRVIEIILSSIDARSLLMGKLLGLGAAGLLQLAIWLMMAVVPAAALVAGLALSPMTVILCLAYFVLGFLLYGTLMSATGVIGTTARDMQQYGMLWVIGAVSPLWFSAVLLREPHGTTARILSYIPITSPSTMMFRIGTGGVPWWEIVLTLALLVGWVFVLLRFAARIFRTGLLMYGKRPSIPELFRWLRQA
ncbi:MAG TPA: ABC transporter permease [Candidatus Polarisedimenticolaceae bacterium]|nr:ABC transporter permease [Candidatus Polarisedimenticolaceae bacterium]